MKQSFEPSERLAPVREAHRSVRAPDELRQRLAARLAPVSRAGLAQRAALPVSGGGFAGRRGVWALLGAAVLAVGVGVVWRASQLPRVQPSGTVALVAEPEHAGKRLAPSEQPAPARPPEVRPCPLQEVHPGAFIGGPREPLHSRASASWHALQQPTPTCGPLERQYIQLRSRSAQPRDPGPVMILIHDTGKNAHEMWIDTRWYFDDLASDGRAIVVFVRATPGRSTRPSSEGSGGWETDDGANPQVDDQAYLRLVLDDMRTRGVITGQNPVWLIGQGGGAALALKAAALHPDLYAGVVAQAPSRLDLPLPKPTETRRLKRALFILDSNDAWASALNGVAAEWAIALGVPSELARRRADAGPGPIPSIRQLDFGTPNQETSVVRILSLAPGADLFPPPGGGDALTLAASRARPDFVNGALEIWRFLSQ